MCQGAMPRFETHRRARTRQNAQKNWRRFVSCAGTPHASSQATRGLDIIMSDHTKKQRDEVRMRLIGLAIVLITGLALAPIVLDAQPSDKIYRIGVLERTPAVTNAANLDGFRQGLRALGYAEGKKLVIEYGSADGRDDGVPELASEQARGKVDLVHTT